MKKILFLLMLTSCAFSQKHELEFEQMVQAEMRSASKKIDFKINPNTQNYDLTYSKLEFTVDPTIANISGVISHTFTALSDMNTVTFDLANNMTVSSVTRNGNPLTFSQATTNELVINFPSTLTTGNSATVVITYSGSPISTGFDSFDASVHGPSSSPVLSTLSEPYGALDWWPTKQDLNDKINSIDVYITAPSQYISVSNGVEPESPIINGSQKTTHFRHNYPIPAYLVAIAVSNYEIYNLTGGLGTIASPYFPIINYIYPETSATMKPTLDITSNIINFYESKIGNYPFRNEKYGHAEFGWGGGMEHTTVSFMTASSGGVMSRHLIAHEMAHQWFGDKITCGSWKDIWLNEGITEYMAGTVVENLDGAAAFVSWKAGKISNITSTTTGNLYLYDSQLTSINRIFSGQMTYGKGSMVTHMLRYIMGDVNFYQALRNYLNDPMLAYKYAVTPQFQAHLEAVHGSSLQEFFDDWVYKEGYPSYNIGAFNSGTNQVTIRVNQTQSITNTAQTGYVSYFEMPVPVRLTLSNGSTADFKLNNTFNGQTFTVNIPAGTTMTGITFDPDKHIISRNNTASLGTDDFSLNSKLNLYPNPSNKFITIELPNMTTLNKIEIYSIVGQKVLESKETIIDISNLSTGVYNVTIDTNEGKALKKFIKN